MINIKSAFNPLCPKKSDVTCCCMNTIFPLSSSYRFAPVSVFSLTQVSGRLPFKVLFHLFTCIVVSVSQVLHLHNFRKRSLSYFANCLIVYK